jgi:uroporphyrinogen III methyltransferase / synthase
MKKGVVYLIGAGPGDVGLITVRGLELLRRADVVVYDRLVDEGLLSNVRSDAELIYVGKSSGSHTVKQDDINRILVAKAKEGKSVVRLKGGDPMVLGRGGEEAEALFKHKISFAVVPGVTSAIAVPEYAGIPVTHRGLAASFAVVTGHEDPTKGEASVEWGELASAADTLVCLMGMGNLAAIVDEILKGGRSPETPVALIRDGTTPRQRTVTGKLSTIVKKTERAGLKPPVVIVVGDVVNLRERLAWFDKQPLFGKRVLVTRSRSQASVLSRMLAERGAEAVELAVIEIKELADASELDDAIDQLKEYQWILFTSVNGVDAVWRRMRALGLDARGFGAARIGAIGPATAERLQELGLYPDFISQEFTSESILKGMKKLGVSGCRILLPRSDIAPRDLVDGLARLGAEPFDVAAYRTVAPADVAAEGKRRLLAGKIDVITFASSSTVANLVALLDGDVESINEAKVACIGPATAAAAAKAGIRVDILAQEHTIPGLVAAMESYFKKGEEVEP